MPRYSRRPFEPSRQRMQTVLSARRVQKTIELAKTLQDDPQRVTRLERQVCMACHYFPVVAGSAFTDQACACCDHVQTFSSTNTDDLCYNCAVEHQLCKHCAGDINMDQSRAEWPAGPAQEVDHAA